MNGEGVNDSSGSSPEIIEHLRHLLGRDVVLLWVSKGEKSPKWRRWQKTTIDMMDDPRYLKNLANDRNIAVLTGEPSGGLCSIDIDDDEAVEPFLALNPLLKETLRSRGQRGCNLWVRVDGSYPGMAVLKRNDGTAWGEWRSTGVCTMIHGLHPAGMSYTRSPEVSPVTVSFNDLVWPDDLELPWLATEDELPATGDESDADIVERYGVPVFYTKSRDGELFVKGINEAYWAALFAAENIVLHEPDERTFFRYAEDSGLYSVISPGATLQQVNWHLSEALETLERAVSESDLIRRERYGASK